MCFNFSFSFESLISDKTKSRQLRKPNTISVRPTFKHINIVILGDCLIYDFIQMITLSVLMQYLSLIEKQLH